MPPQNFDWQAFLAEYTEQLRNPPNFIWNGEAATPNSPPFGYKTSYDDKARLSFDYEVEAIDINEPDWKPEFRWFNNRPHDKFVYQYKPFDQWFTLFEITGEVLFKARQGKISLTDIGFQMRELVEKRYYKVERIY